MRVLSLTVNNFGVFRGRHQFDLAPTHKGRGTYRHLVAISGQNGVGKSTLFQALGLALHGPLSLSDRVSRQDYSRYLLGRLHRSNDMGVPVVSRDGSVEIRFEYIQSGKPLQVEIKRHWHRSGATVNEMLAVSCDGKPLDIDPADYQTWINDLASPGLASLCFFDAEKLDALSISDHGRLMGNALRRLLGLDLVERLQADLERYTLLHGGGHKAVESLREKALEHQAAIDKLDDKIELLRKQSDELAVGADRLEEELVAQESRFASEGSAYAARRPALQDRLTKIQSETKKIAAQIEELSGELLPFCLVPELCQRLGRRLIEEAKAHLRLSAEDLWQERLANFCDALQKDVLWEGLRLSAKGRSILAERLINELQGSAEADSVKEFKFIHNLAEPEEVRLHDWIRQAFQVVPNQVKGLCDGLRNLQIEQRQIESELQKAPDDDVLAPIHAEIARLQEAIQMLQRQQAGLSEQVGSLQYQREEHVRHLQRVDGELRKAQASEQRLALAERSKHALQAYRDKLMQQRAAALEEKLLASFNAICRKERLLGSVYIDTNTFGIELHGIDGESLNVEEFSAGERQLYALAWLWALRQVSGYRLPLAIDTPLARLDDIHRSRFIHDYVPAVSDQVILFATDMEMDAKLLLEVKPYLARLYQLQYDQQSKETFVSCLGQSAPREVVLYRAQSSAEYGRASDIGAGCGQVWLYEAERANGNSGNGQSLERVALPKSSSRLMLIDPKSGSYNWLHVAELEKIVGQKHILNQLRSGYQIYDLWQEEWALLVRQAGYDSVATVNIEGPVEYVLNVSKLVPQNGKTAMNNL